MSEVYNSKTEAEDVKLGKQFLQFLEENIYNSAELREAYFLLCGVDLNGGEATERVSQLKEKMEEMTNLRYPLNRFFRMITELENWENSVQNFDNYLSKLKVSDGEKELLNGIVERQRIGELEIHYDDRIIADLLIAESASKEGLAIALKEQLEEVLSKINLPDNKKGAKLSFWFEEGKIK